MFCMKELLLYFVLAYGISWVLWFPLYAHIWGVTGLPTLPFHHGIGGLGPMLSAFITTALFRKKEGLRVLLRQCVQIKPLLYVLIAFCSPFLIGVLSIAANTVLFHSPAEFGGLLSSKEFPTMNIVQVVLYNIVFFGFGEEVGWRGFALPRFQGRLNALSSALLLNVFWALWHLPLFLYRPGYTGMDAGSIIGWFFSLLTGSILLSWLYNSSRASILVCAIFHSTIDIALTGNFSDSSAMNTMGSIITIWGILTVIQFKPRNLSLHTKETFSGFFRT